MTHQIRSDQIRSDQIGSPSLDLQICRGSYKHEYSSGLSIAPAEGFLLPATYFVPEESRGPVYPSGTLLTPLEPQSRFGDKLLEIRVVCPQSGTAVLKG